ncbi:MAG: hypothetical protein KatS3mg102_2699 [Planctomycetota bacterium]|nr:MAG: hypothetical protein KatS3mg102_2699 [Planctomycetota bacterium]
MRLRLERALPPPALAIGSTEPALEPGEQPPLPGAGSALQQGCGSSPGAPAPPWPAGTGIAAVTLCAVGAPLERVQRQLFATGGGRRDLAAADRALARLRARFGEQAVVRAVLRDAHLPEAGFAWEPLVRLPRLRSPLTLTLSPASGGEGTGESAQDAPFQPHGPAQPGGGGEETEKSAHGASLQPHGPAQHASRGEGTGGSAPLPPSPHRGEGRGEGAEQTTPASALPGAIRDERAMAHHPDAGEVPPPRPLVRRLLAQPAPMPAPAPARLLAGPFLFEGGWWQPQPFARAYHYLPAPAGELLWVFCDRTSGRWFVQGTL